MCSGGKKFVAAFPGAAEGQLMGRDEGGRGEGRSRAEVTWGMLSQSLWAGAEVHVLGVSMPQGEAPHTP